MAERKSVLNWQLFVGFILVVTGGLFLADQFVDIDIMRNYWPLLVVLLGLTFFIGMILAGRRWAGLAIPGAVITLAGIILYIHNIFHLWITWTYAWGLLISAVGFGMLIMNLYLKRDGLRKAAGWVMGIGLILFVVFGIFFEVVLDLAGSNIKSGVFLGSGLVLLGLFVVFSRLIFSSKRKEVKFGDGGKEPTEASFEKPVEKLAEEEGSGEAEVPTSSSEDNGTSLTGGEEFTQLEFEAGGHVYLQQGEVCSLEIKGDQELINKLKIEVADQILSITFQSEEKAVEQLIKQSSLEYAITLKSLERLNLSGVGNVHGEGFSGERLAIVHSSEGEIRLKDLHYQALDVAFEGIGEIELSGEVQSQDVDVSGLGTYNAEELTSQQADVTVSGAGSARLWVESILDATLSGAGNILYKGHPEIKKWVSGLGSIKPLETA